MKLTPKQKLEKRKMKMRNIISDVRVYFFVIPGILVQAGLDHVRQEIDFSRITLKYMAYALLSALVVMIFLESQGNSPAGKRKNIKQRIFYAFLIGYTATDAIVELGGIL